MATANERQLIEWGSRLFYSMPTKGKRVRDVPSFSPGRVSANEIRNRVRQAVSPRAKQVVVKITGGGRGMAPVAAHLRYIARQGQPEVGGKGKSLELEDQDGEKISGTEQIKELQSDWRVAGSFIPESSARKEAFNIVLSMPSGTPAEHVLNSAREFAKEHFTGHKYVFVLHDDTDSPHVHLAVKAERWDGKRLNPRKTDLQQWRESFAQKLQDRGIDAITTRAASRNQTRAPQAIWRLKAGEAVQKPRPSEKSAESTAASRSEAVESWTKLREALATSGDPSDRALSIEVSSYMAKTFASKPAIAPDQAVPAPGLQRPRR